MKKSNIIFKLMACMMAGLFILAGCQKEDKENTPEGGGMKAYTKAAQVVDYMYPEDWGTSADWLGSKGILNFLSNGKSLWNTELGQLIRAKEVPSGFIMDKKSSAYVTYVGGDASFNNALGYYTYKAGDNVDAEYLLKQIFDTDEDGTLFFKQVIFEAAKDLSHGKTFQISDGQLDKDVIIGFYLIPNAGSYTKDGKIYPKYGSNGRPMFITTNKMVNTTTDDPYGEEGTLSHIVGRSVCGDMVIVFEDLNSMYSKTSDEDFNDLAFVIGCELDSRTNKAILPYPYDAVPEPTQLPVFGDNCYDKIICEEGIVNMRSLINDIQEKYTLTESDARYKTYMDVWSDDYKPYLDLTDLDADNVKLYAKVAYKNASNVNLIGWYPYVEGQNTLDQIKSRITNKSGEIYRQYVIKYTSAVKVNAPENNQYLVTLDGQDLDSIGTFQKGQKIGFFILANGSAVSNWSTSSTNYSWPSGAIFKCSTVREDITVEKNGKTSTYKNAPSAIMVGSECSNLVVAFEDLKSKSDNDYNDMIFHVTDNLTSLTWESSGSLNIGQQFFNLETLNELYDLNKVAELAPKE